MNDTSVTHVLILAAADVGRRWEAVLEGPQTTVWPGRDAIPPGEHPEIIIADATVPLVKARDSAVVIRVGGDQPSVDSLAADVCLPADCSAEEFHRTYQLVSEIVRLRRQQNHAAMEQRALVQAAMTDPLTGLANRRAWDAELSRRLVETGVGRQFCLAFIDLDQLKEINDTHGHAAGDRLLQTVARAIADSVRQEDFVARLGGDEFGLLFWSSNEADVAAVVERVRRRIAKSAHEIGFDTITASAGFAVSEVPLAADTAKSLYMAADMALLAAKYSGGNRCMPNPSATR